MAIRVFGREMVGLHGREDLIRGTCDGRLASARIIQTYRGRVGQLILQAGRWTREIPAAFLNGSLLTSSLHSVQLACDGRRLQLHALAIRSDQQGELIMDIQNAIMDMQNGDLSLTELRTLSPAETRSEFQGRSLASTPPPR